jgi:hypothetical protein
MQSTSSDEKFSGRDQADGEAALVAETIPGDNAQPFTVSEISSALKRSVERDFGHVRIRGEISGFKRAASGHCYMGLKDEKAVIDGIVWKGQAARLAFNPEDGFEVIATGKLTTYPGRSKYQIVIERLEVAGAGALMQLLEQRRKTLTAEGLFAEERKQRLPYLPKTIGVVTSPTGAVIRDILHRLADRMPSHVILWPVIVQGEGAAEQVARAVRGFDAMAEGGPIARPDLLWSARLPSARSPSFRRLGMRPIRPCATSRPTGARRRRPRPPRWPCRSGPSFSPALARAGCGPPVRSAALQSDLPTGCPASPGCYPGPKACSRRRRSGSMISASGHCAR